MTRLSFDLEKQSVTQLIESLINGYQNNCKGKRELECNKEELINELQIAEKEYIQRAKEKQLHLLPERFALVNPNIDMRLLETYRGRIDEENFLPELVKSAQTCCYCGIKSKVTHEHVLKKESYYQYAITPCNIVPACSDCNNGKGTWSMDDDQKKSPFHPYFENYDFRPFLSCSLVFENPSNHFPISNADYNHYFEMEIDIQQNYSLAVNANEYERYMNNFKMFKLNKIYSIYANAIIQSFVVTMKRYQVSESTEFVRDTSYVIETIEDWISLKEDLNQTYSFMNEYYSELLALKKLKEILTVNNPNHDYITSKFINWVNTSSITI